MKTKIALLTLLVLGCTLVPPAFSNTPFTSKPQKQHVAPAPPVKSRFFVKLIIWQQQLKQKMSDLIREGRTSHRIQPFLFVLLVGFAYGAVHAAGPGHGKFVAMSYVLSHRATLAQGLLFGNAIALIHGFSGAVGVLCLRYILQHSVSKTLGEVTHTTQIVSFALIFLLGLGIFLAKGYALFFKHGSNLTEERKTIRKSWVPWALAVGLVPCPAVVMVMLFCMSMEALPLGVMMAVAISLGMATTLSFVIVAAIAGKTGVMQTVSSRRREMVEHGVGMVSGAAVMGFGGLFFLAFIG